MNEASEYVDDRENDDINRCERIERHHGYLWRNAESETQNAFGCQETCCHVLQDSSPNASTEVVTREQNLRLDDNRGFICTAHLYTKWNSMRYF